jgi:hypothetical protein
VSCPHILTSAASVGAAHGVDQTASGGGLASNFLLGCDGDGNGCRDQNSAMSRAEVAFPHVAAGAAFIHLSNVRILLTQM